MGLYRYQQYTDYIITIIYLFITIILLYNYYNIITIKLSCLAFW